MQFFSEVKHYDQCLGQITSRLHHHEQSTSTTSPTSRPDIKTYDASKLTREIKVSALSSLLSCIMFELITLNFPFWSLIFLGKVLIFKLLCEIFVQEVLQQMLDIESKVVSLFSQSGDIVPVHLRREPLPTPIKIVALVTCTQKEVGIHLYYLPFTIWYLVKAGFN